MKLCHRHATLFGLGVSLLVFVAYAEAEEAATGTAEHEYTWEDLKELTDDYSPEDTSWNYQYVRGGPEKPNGPLGATGYVYEWNGPRQAYCEARLSGFVESAQDFTYEHWREVEQRLVEEWFPVGTSVDDAFDHFASEKFGYVFRNYGDAGADENVLRDNSERYVRFETWSSSGRSPYLQHLVYFVFDKVDPKWSSKRVVVVHKIHRKRPMSKLLEECALEDVKRDREKFDWNRADHFFTEARNLGLANWRATFREKVLEKTVWSLWKEWFPEGGSVHEVATYLIKHGFYPMHWFVCDSPKPCIVFKLRTDDGSLLELIFFATRPPEKRHHLNLELTLKIPKIGSADTVRLTGVRASNGNVVADPGQLKWQRRIERAKLLARIAKREGRDLYE